MIEAVSALFYREKLEICCLSRLDLDAALRQINQAVLRAPAREELFSLVCQSIAELAHFKVAWIDWLDTASNRLVPAATADDGAAMITEQFVSHCHCGLAVIQSGLPCVIDDLLAAPARDDCQKIAETLGLRACAAYPIRLQDQICGVLTVGTVEACSWNADEARFLEEVTLNLSFGLENFEAKRRCLEAEQRCREAEDAVREGEQLLNLFLQSGLDGFYVVDMQGRLLQVNDAYCAMSGYTRQELLQMRVADVESVESEQEVVAHMQRIMRQGMDRFESRHRCKDERIIDVETSVTFRDFDGGRFFCFLRDNTERMRAELSQQESEVRFRRVVEAAPVGIYIASDNLFRYLNPAALAMFGAESAEQIVGQSILDRIHPDSRPAVIARARSVQQERKAVPLLEEQHLRLDGTVFDTEVAAVPFIFEGHEGAIVFISDTTERKREADKTHALEQQLRQAQKLEAVGRLAGGVAHDFNNLLMVIQTYTEMLQDRLPIQDSLRRNTEQVLKAAERGASLTGQMLAFSRKQIISPIVLDLNAVIDETAKMLKRLIGEDIEFCIDSGESLWAIEADPDQIAQVLMNLCVNSRDAMPQGGTLTIATQNVTLADESIGAHTDIPAGEYVRLAVTDTGAGISEGGTGAHL